VLDVLDVHIAGSCSLPPSPEIPLALDEMIYEVTSGALADSGLSMRDIHGSYMAASDLYDGRAISTMTLTGSTGSFHKSEMRVCNDSLAALMLAAAEVASGGAEAVIVCTWCKLSDASREEIVPLAIEPVFHRPLGYHPDAVLALRRSAEIGAPTAVAEVRVAPADVATAMVLTSRPAGSRRARVVSFGASNGSYLIPGQPVLEPLTQSATRALGRAGRDIGDMVTVWAGGLPLIPSREIASALGVDEDRLRRLADVPTDLGYAAGLTHVHAALDSGQRGPVLVVSGGGIGVENTFATVVEVV
jgi:hypothetical protein